MSTVTWMVAAERAGPPLTPVFTAAVIFGWRRKTAASELTVGRGAGGLPKLSSCVMRTCTGPAGGPLAAAGSGTCTADGVGAAGEIDMPSRATTAPAGPASSAPEMTSVVPAVIGLPAPAADAIVTITGF